MTEIKPDAHHVMVDSSRVIGPHRFRLTTILADGKVPERSNLRDAWASPTPETGERDRSMIRTAALRGLAALLLEHADAVDLLERTYQPARWETPRTMVAPGFPAELRTLDDVNLAWPDGVRVYDDEAGLEWERIDGAWSPGEDRPTRNLGEDVDGVPAYLPVRVLADTWPTTTDTTPEH